MKQQAETIEGLQKHVQEQQQFYSNEVFQKQEELKAKDDLVFELHSQLEAMEIVVAACGDWSSDVLVDEDEDIAAVTKDQRLRKRVETLLNRCVCKQQYTYSQYN